MKTKRKRLIRKLEIQDEIYENWKADCESVGASQRKDKEGKVYYSLTIN